MPRPNLEHTERASAMLDTLRKTPTTTHGLPMDKHSWHTMFGTLSAFTPEALNLATDLSGVHPWLSSQLLDVAVEGEALINHLRTYRRGDNIPHLQYAGLTSKFAHWCEMARVSGIIS